jgi:hypothetical protein
VSPRARPWRQKTDFPRSPHELATSALWDETSRQGFIEYRYIDTLSKQVHELTLIIKKLSAKAE